MKYKIRDVGLGLSIQRKNEPFTLGAAAIMGGASMLSGLFSGIFGSSSTKSANEANLQIARETNASNQEIARKTNEANIAMVEANNATQRQLQQEMNEYNSIGAQLERGADAGVNPNSILGGVSGNVQTTLPSTQAGHADMIPNQPVTMATGVDEKIGLLNGLLNAGNLMSQAKVNEANADKITSEADWWKTEASFAKKVKELGIKATEQEIANMKLEGDKLAQEVKNSGEVFKQLQLGVQLMDSDAKMKAYEALNYKDWYDAQLHILQTQADYTDDMAHYTLEKLKVDIGVARSNQSLLDAEKRLSDSQKRLCDKNYEIAKEGQEQAAHETYLFKKYGEENRWNEINNLKHEGRLKGAQKRLTDEGVSNAQWENSGTQRGIRTMSTIIHSANEAVQTYTSVVPRSKVSSTVQHHYNGAGKLTGYTDTYQHVR